MDTQDKEIEKALHSFAIHLDNECFEQLKCCCIEPDKNKHECIELGFQPRGIIILPKNIAKQQIEQLKLIEEFSLLMAMPIEDVKNATSVLMGVGESFENSLKLLNEAITLSQPPIMNAQEIGEQLSESMKQISISCNSLGKEKYMKPIKSHNDRFVRRNNNKSRW